MSEDRYDKERNIKWVRPRLVLDGDMEDTAVMMIDLFEELEEMKRRIEKGIPLPEFGPCMPKYRTITAIMEDGTEIRIDDDIPYKDEAEGKGLEEG